MEKNYAVIGKKINKEVLVKERYEKEYQNWKRENNYTSFVNKILFAFSNSRFSTV